MDVAKLLQLGKGEKAQVRIGFVCKEALQYCVHLKISEYCESIKNNLEKIAHAEVCPPELQEQVEGICFAASFFSDLPELLEIREIFTTKFGKKYVVDAQELDPCCHVNRQFSTCLCMKDIPDRIKRDVLEEITARYELKQGNGLFLMEQEDDEEEEEADDEQEQIQVGINADEVNPLLSQQGKVHISSSLDSDIRDDGIPEVQDNFTIFDVTEENLGVANLARNLVSRKKVPRCRETRQCLMKRPCNRKQTWLDKSNKEAKSAYEDMSSSPPHRPPPIPPPPSSLSSRCTRRARIKPLHPVRAPPPPPSLSVSSMAISCYNKIVDDRTHKQSTILLLPSAQVQYNESYDGICTHPRQPKYEDIFDNLKAMKKN
ncbi:hypothetical protein KP509_18G067500 [Ceratopteris richardii]|nr:hypothetical protein KP509_18G067500 [Ceratopteris richardii]